MIDILGRKRVIMIGVFLFLNAIFALGVFLYLKPLRGETETKLQAISAKELGLRDNIYKLQMQLSDLKVRQKEFKDIKARRFFTTQSRRQAVDLLNEIKTRSNMLVAVVKIGAGTIMDTQEARQIDHQIIETPIMISLEAEDDVAVYQYLEMVLSDLPGHVSITNVVLSREKDVTATVLRGLSSGQGVPMVKAEIELLWHSLSPIDNAGGGING